MSTDAQVLVVTVRLMDGRFHGEPEWPPAPARLFQALIAGGSAGTIRPELAAALRWLEAQPPPSIAAPTSSIGHQVLQYVPNNDLDAKDGNPDRVADIRTGKMVRPRIFDSSTPLLYAWNVRPAEAKHSAQICELALKLYQFGRGVDMAWATAEVVDARKVSDRLLQYPGEVYRPNGGNTGNAKTLFCPQPGSMDSLDARYAATLERFTDQGSGRRQTRIFRQPPKPRFVKVAYNSPPHRCLFDLRPPRRISGFATTDLPHIVRLTETLRDHAAERLTEALPSWKDEIEQALVGRQVEGKPSLPANRRVRLIPIPSIGHEKVDRGIRRLLVEVPGACPLRKDDVFWAFSGLTIPHRTGVNIDVVRSQSHTMRKHYDASSTVWRTVTPAALPARRRRIDPRRRREPEHRLSENKGGVERAEEEACAARAVSQALRHADIGVAPLYILVQREPFEEKGTRAESFAAETRFNKRQLWHVELRFQDPIAGPIVLGDGRFLGLGIMRPSSGATAPLTYKVTSGLTGTEPEAVATSLRRAVMARVQGVVGAGKPLPSYVSGHDADGQPTNRPHLCFVFDPFSERLLIVPPHVADQRAPRSERVLLDQLQTAMAGFVSLRAGSEGVLSLIPGVRWSVDPLFAQSKRWVSRTSYVVNRHLKGAGASETLRADIITSCRNAGLPTPHVKVLETRGVSGLGLTGFAELSFKVAVPGPILLGRTRHKGGGLFGHVTKERG